MRGACLPANEAERLLALQGLDILDTPPEPEIDDVTALAASVFDVPIVAFSLIDCDRQWFKSRLGLEASETPRDWSFCAHAILSNATLIVPDAQQDPRFLGNPLVTGRPYIRFYAGAPVHGPMGERIGVLCVIDTRPRPEFSEAQAQSLRRMADIIEHTLQARQASKRIMGEVAERQQLLAEMEMTRRDLEDRLTRKRQFLSKLAHDLRTPLNSILCCATMLKNEIHGPHTHKRYRDYSEIIETASGALSQLCTTVSDYGKASSGRMELSLQKVALQDMLADVLEIMMRPIRTAELKLETSFGHHTQTVNADPARLKQVFLNILSNAVKFTPSGGTVRIRTELDEEGRSCVIVQDTGVGISPADIGRVFEPFGRRGSGADGQKPGSGLGLALARLITERHGGTLALSSKPGDGTSVTIALPSATSGPTLAAQAAA